MELNSREISLLIWIGIVTIALLLSRTIRPSLLGVFRALLHPKIVDVVGLAALYSAGCVWALHKLSLWEWSNLKTVILWFLTTAFVAMADTKRLEKGSGALAELAKEALAITAIVTFIGGINTLPLWGELLLLPTIVFIAAVAAVAGQNPDHRPIATLASSILVFAGFGILSYSAYETLSDWRKFDAGFQALEFVIPIVLTFLFLPFLYGLMLFMAFENAAIRLGFSMKDRTLRRFTWLRGLFYFGVNVGAFRRFVHAVQVASPSDRNAVRSVIRELRAARQRERRPLPVDFDEGWSPYLAKNFLAGSGLSTGDYNPSVIDWSASSEHLKLTNEVLPDHLVYRMAGTPTAVTELELELEVRNRKHADSDQAFWSEATKLVLEALGGEAADRFAALVPIPKAFSMESGTVRLDVKYDAWSIDERSGYSRTLVIHHPAHDVPFSEFN